MAIGLGINVRRVEDVRGVVVVIAGPVGDRAQGGTGLEGLGRAKHRHETHEATIATTIDADSLVVALMLFDQPVDAIQIVLQLGMAHPPIDRGAPVASVAL